MDRALESILFQAHCAKEWGISGFTHRVRIPVKEIILENMVWFRAGITGLRYKRHKGVQEVFSKVCSWFDIAPSFQRGLF